MSGDKISSEFAEKINEVSLLLVMSAPEDDIGIELISDICDGFTSFQDKSNSAIRVVKAWDFIKSKKSSCDKPTFFKLLEEFIKASVQLSSGNLEFVLPGETAEPIAGNIKAKNAPHQNSVFFSQPEPQAKQSEVDYSFVPEFIENQRMQLEDFESWLLDCEFKNEHGEDVTALVKRYIHSLKGDSGAIGLKGIEEACHFVEEIMTNITVPELVGQLIFFREWILAELDSLANKKVSKDSAKAFIERFKKSCALLLLTTGGDLTAEEDLESQGHEQSNLEQVYMLSGEKEIFQEFVGEATEHLGNVEAIMLESEGSYTKDSIDTVFRGIHSLKGGSAYFNFKEMTETSHILENLLVEVRDGKRELDQELTGIVLSYIDLQKKLLNSAKTALSKDCQITRCQESIDLLATLHTFATGKPLNKTKAVKVPTNAKSVTAGTGNSPATNSNGNDKLEIKNFVKVDTVRLDHLIDSIGEMVIYSSMLIRRCRELLPQHEDVQSITHRVEKFTRDLQDVGMSMRLVPIKGLFQKMSRLVWDTSKKIQKEIAFSMEGEDTELDRNLIDKLADPLMHMIRNALDHGVEPPDERVSVGKPKSGKVHLSATHSGGSILIKIQDDGRGLNPEKLLAKAREKGIIQESQKLTEQEIYQLIFAAGFSTAAVVTDISGRGVGMDVVRKNVESLRGRIHIESELGKGTTFTIELPLTLAIVDGIEVAVGPDRLIIPSLSIVEFVRPTKDTLNNTLEQGETFYFRGKYLPVYRLGDLFGIDPRYNNPLDATLIIVENHDELIALMVDGILGELSTVIKSLGPLFSEQKGISGCAVMPNGDVALIIDIRSLVQLARTTYQNTSSPLEDINSENLLIH